MIYVLTTNMIEFTVRTWIGGLYLTPPLVKCPTLLTISEDSSPTYTYEL